MISSTGIIYCITVCYHLYNKLDGLKCSVSAVYVSIIYIIKVFCNNLKVHWTESY